jgi:hypothetical protein
VRCQNKHIVARVTLQLGFVDPTVRYNSIAKCFDCVVKNYSINIYRGPLCHKKICTGVVAYLHISSPI